MTKDLTVQVDKHYSAFISYRHVPKDREWARWLLNTLETFHVPKALQKKGCPARLRKLFRDEEEIPASSDLSDQIRDALEQSDYLIVVCSRATPESAWVSEEIRAFHAMGRSDRILVLLVEGEPEEAFPELLFKVPRSVSKNGEITWKEEAREPIAADVRPRSDTSDKALKDAALLRIAAALLGVRYDDLRQRDAQRRAKSRRLMGALAASFLLSVSAGGIYWWDNTRVKIAHFANYTTKFAVPTGVGPVTNAEQGKRFASYRIERQGGQVRALQSIGGSGHSNRFISGDNFSRMEIAYRGDAVESIKVFGADGELLRTEEYEFSADNTEVVSVFRAGPGRAFTQATQSLSQRQLFANDALTDTARTAITQNRMTLDENGYVTERLFEDFYGTLKADANGVYGVGYELDSDGLVHAAQSLDSNGVPTAERSGVARIVHDRNDEGTIVQSRTYNLGGQLTLNPLGVSQTVVQIDEQGNFLRVEYLETEGNPTASKLGYASITAVYDERGNRTETARFSPSGEPTIDAKGGYHLLKFEYDAAGNNISSMSFGIDMQLVLNSEGYARTDSDFDGDGRITGTRYFDIKGAPVLTISGIAEVKTSFTQSGKIAEYAFFGTHGEPVLGKDGFYRSANTYNKQGQDVRWDYFGVDDKLILRKGGYASVEIAHDARGNAVRWDYYDAQGNRTVIETGWATQNRQYDGRGKVIEIGYLDEKGDPILAPSGYAGRRNKYDDRGNLVKVTYLGLNGEPYQKGVAFSSSRSKYDARGNAILRETFSADGQLANNNDGIARTTFGYDEKSQIISNAYFDATGAASSDTNGISKWKFTFDDDGNQILIQYLDEEGKLTLIKEGYAQLAKVFDTKGRIVERHYLGTDGKPILTTDGVASQKIAFDTRGNEIEEFFLGVDGKPVMSSWLYARKTSEYDTRGNVLQLSYFDENGQLVAVNQGFAIGRYKYNDRNNRIGFAFFGADEKPTYHEDGYASAKMTFDHLGEPVERETFGIDGEPILNRERVWRIKYKRDAQGRVIREDYFGTDGKPINNRSKSLIKIGIARIDYIYDTFGNIAETRQFVVEPDTGKVVLNRVLFATHDARGNLVEEWAQLTDGTPLQGPNGFARNTNTYDDRGQLIERAYFDRNDQAVLYQGLYHIIRFRYDAVGNLVETSSHDVSGDLTKAEYGKARTRKAFDKRGNVIYAEMFDENDKPITIEKDGERFARLSTTYDSKGMTLSQSLFEVSEETGKSDLLVYKRENVYDTRGNLTEVRRFKADDSILIRSGDYAVTRYTYDYANRVISQEYLNEDLTPAQTTFGYSQVSYVYDTFGSVIKTSYYGVDGSPAMHHDGYSVFTRTYDARGNGTSLAYFDQDGAAVMTTFGYARQTALYDTQNRIIDNAWFDAEGNPIAPEGNKDSVVRKRFAFDRRGEPIYQVSFYGSSKFGVREVRDAQGRIIESTWVTDGDEVVIGPNGIASLQKLYGDGANYEQTTYDTDGTPMLHDEGYARKIYTRIDANTYEYRYFGSDLAPILLSHGEAGIREKTDEQGRIIRRTYLDADGNRTTAKEGYAGYDVFLSDEGKQLAFRFFDTEDRFMGSNYPSDGKIKAAMAAKDAAALRELLPQQVAQIEAAGFLDNVEGLMKYSFYVGVAFNALFASDFELAEASSNTAIALAPDRLAAETNLASAYMFLGRTEAARVIYLKNKGAMATPKTTWEQAVLSDFDLFEEHGLIDPLMDEVRDALASP